MKTCESVLVALLLAAAAAMPCAAQQAPSTPQALPNDICAGCFAYLEFPPSLEPASYAMRSLPAADESNNPVGEQTAGLLVASKQ